MSAPTDQITEQFNEIAARAQESVTTAVRSWADAVQSVTDGLLTERQSLIDPNVVVEKYFDFAQQVLDSQRQFARTVLTAGAQAAQSVTEQATATAKQAVDSVESTTVKAPAAPKTARATKAASKS